MSDAEPERGLGGDRPYPLQCPKCGKLAVWPAVIPYDARVRHDERLHEFQIADLEVDQCRGCQEILFSNTTDEQIFVALREHLGLLQSDQIRLGVESLGLSREQFCQRIGVDTGTLSDWMDGLQVQSRAMDDLMRGVLENALSSAR